MLGHGVTGSLGEDMGGPGSLLKHADDPLTRPQHHSSPVVPVGMIKRSGRPD